MFILNFTIGYCLLYLGLAYLFPLFFTGRRPINVGEKISPRVILLIIIVTLAIFSFTTRIQDPMIENRLQHALGGGFLAFFICFLAARSSGVKITRFQFFFFSFLIATALGVANEILEYFLQTYTSLHFASSVADTWLDLVSNTVGILVATAIFLPFRRRLEEGEEEGVRMKGS